MSSSQSDETNASEVGTIANLVLVNRLQLVIVTVFLYEYIITFGREVSLFWLRKKTGASWLFFIVRYLALFEYSFLGGISHIRMTDQSCLLLERVVFAVQFIQFLPWAVFTALRALALSNMNWPLASVVFVLSSSFLAVSAWQVSLADIVGGNSPLVGCTGGPDLTPDQTLIAVVISRSCGIVADVIVIVVTWQYALKHRAARAFAIQRGVLSSLGKVLVVNGTLYFIVILAINIIQVIPLLSALGRRSPVVQFFVIVDPITAILISRFMLALQAANQQVLQGQAVSATLNDTGAMNDNLGEMGFAPRGFVDSMGGTIPSTDPESTFGGSDDHDHPIIHMRALPRRRA